METNDTENAQKLDAIFAQFEKKYPKKLLLEAISNFNWNKEDPSDSLRKRQSVSDAFRNWAKDGAPKKNALEMADAVMKWGFNRKSPRALGENLDHFCQLIRAWHKEEDRNEMHTLLAQNLDLYGIGIARSSKWICFIDEQRFGIFDSRVSAALRTIVIDGKRVFPTVQRRPTKSRKYPNYTPRKPEIMASEFWQFTELLRKVANEYRINRVADVEMGLFMLGDDASNW